MYFYNKQKMQQRIVILGAGFAGLQLARRLKGSNFDITLIDQYNFHQFQPLFYQVATARLEPSSVSFPLRKVFQNKANVQGDFFQRVERRIQQGRKSETG